MSIKRFKIIREERGDLVPIEFYDLPFLPKRAFYVIEVPAGEVRGNHAHYQCQQFLFCVSGMIEVKLFNGVKTSIYTLLPGQGILVDALVWDSQNFLTGKDVLLVFASMPYDAKDYILDRDEFIKIKRTIE